MTTEDRRPHHNPEVITQEEHSFDELARGLADGTVSRERALRLVGGALLGSLLGFPFLGEAWGQSNSVNQNVGGGGAITTTPAAPILVQAACYAEAFAASRAAQAVV
jgi:hypothetical protein